MCYRTVECLNIPRALFEDERYRNLSNNAKLLYSLFLERLKYASMNGWVDIFGFPYIYYPKTEIMHDLRCSRYAADAAVNELKNGYELVCITCPEPGKANRIYVKDITKEIVEEEMRGETAMSRIKKDMENLVEENMEKELDDIEVGIGDEIDPELDDLGECYDEDMYVYFPDTKKKERRLKQMIEADYATVEGILIPEHIDADAMELGLEMALSLIAVFGKAYRVEFMEYLNHLYEEGHHARLEGAITMLALVLDSDKNYLECMNKCFGEARMLFQGGVLNHMEDIVNIYNAREE